jgi:hypothetical protein
VDEFNSILSPQRAKCVIRVAGSINRIANDKRYAAIVANRRRFMFGQNSLRDLPTILGIDFACF